MLFSLKVVLALRLKNQKTKCPNHYFGEAGMNNKFNFINYENITADTVIRRGYEIYDEWVKYQFSSRQIVNSVERSVSSVDQVKTNIAIINALSYLFALDMRVKERYKNIIQCILKYFAWRRETNALKRLKVTLRIKDNKDIREAIEIEIQKIREKLQYDDFDDADDEARGGKYGKKSEDLSTEKRGQEQAPEKNTEEITEPDELKEASEEKTEELSEQKKSDGSAKEREANQHTLDSLKEEPDIIIQEEKNKITQAKPNKIEIENNGTDAPSEPNENKSNEVKTYNDAVDSPPLYEDSSVNKSTNNTMSFIDEAILDNMIKYKDDFVTDNPLNDLKQNSETFDIKNVNDHKIEESKSFDKDDYLYDKIAIPKNNDSTQSVEKDSNIKPTDKASELKNELKTELKQETVQINENTERIKKEFEQLRVPLQVDITNSEINQVIHDINKYMSDESKEAYYNWQSEVAREQMSIDLEEGHIDKIEISEPLQTKSHGVGINRK